MAAPPTARSEPESQVQVPTSNQAKRRRVTPDVSGLMITTVLGPRKDEEEVDSNTPVETPTAVVSSRLAAAKADLSLIQRAAAMEN